MGVQRLSTIERAISTWYKQEMGWKNPFISIRPLHKNLIARMYPPLSRAVGPQHPVYLVVATDEGSHTRAETILKIHESAESATTEFDLLSKLNEKPREVNTEYDVPVPLVVFPDRKGLLMSRVEGRPLNEILWPPLGAWFKKDYLSITLASIGRAVNWLAHYQRIRLRDECPHTFRGNTLHEYVSSKLKLASENGLDSKSVQRVQNCLSESEGSISTMSSQCVPLCSFDPEHIYISESRTSVVDFEEPDCGWPAQDPASFLAYIDLKWSPFSDSVSHEDVLATFRRTFVDRYDATFSLTLGYMYLSDLLDAFLDPWISSGLSLLTRGYLIWKSRLAKDLIHRSSKESWEALMGQHPSFVKEHALP